MENLVGIRGVNEAKWLAEGMWEWYEGVIEEIGAVGEGAAVYISDGWDLKRRWSGCGKGGGGEIRWWWIYASILYF